MGACIGRSRRERGNTSAVSSDASSTSRNGFVGKNHPLKQEKVRWKSDIPLTDGQLRSKRDEFWDTAPAFDGRKEIWDALRAASTAVEISDYQLAQAILDGANISLPHGLLTECYDELGNRYQVPVYCLSYPINIIKEGDGRDSPAEWSEPVEGGMEFVLKVRLSLTSRDVKISVLSTDTIAMAKRRVQSQEGVEASSQRWFYGGKLLGDKIRLEEAKIPPGHVVQVIINADGPRRKVPQS